MLKHQAIQFVSSSKKFHKQIGVFIGGAAAQAPKRAKIIDSDNEEQPVGEEENVGNQANLQNLVDGGDSSDEGVTNDPDRTYVCFRLQ